MEISNRMIAGLLLLVCLVLSRVVSSAAEPTVSYSNPAKQVAKGSGQGHWHTYSVPDGLADNIVWSIIQDREGSLWFGTNSGVSRYDGGISTTFTTQHGLANNIVRSIIQDREGSLWFGTRDGGVSRYDGKTFTTFTKQDGLAYNIVTSIIQDQEGSLWFGTYSRGVSRYNGQIFTTFTTQDGLAHNDVSSIIQDQEGSLWFGTGGGGVTRYRPPLPVPPPVFIDAVLANRRYEGVSDITIPSTVELTMFEFHGISFKTRPEAMVYRYRLNGYEKDWKTTHARRVEYQNLPTGHYTFQIQAVDRDLVYSEIPAKVSLTVHMPYGIIALSSGLAVALVGLTVSVMISIKHRRERDRTREALLAEAEKELQTAHEMQMGLMPKEAPEIKGFDIAGRCIPANHVGGDFFQYFEQNGKLALTMADVTGHAMEAAIPVVLFDGVLESHIHRGEPVKVLFSELNRTLHRTLGSRTFVCFTLGELDPSTHTFRLSNGGCPYPYHFRASTGEIVELQVDAYPLGVRPDTEYEVLETQLQPGDRVVFCSDGIIEAENTAGEQFGFDQTTETIRKACKDDLSAEACIDLLLTEVNAFSGDAPQGDDMTCVVLRVE